MHAVYSVSTGPGTRNHSRKPRTKREALQEVPDTRLFHHIVKKSNFAFKRGNAPEYGTIGQRSLLSLAHAHHLSRRALDEAQGIGLNGKGTNLRMIRLIYNSESFELGTDTNLAPSAIPRDTNFKDSGLVNPLVIGISALCVILVGALVVVGVMYRRKSQRQLPVEASATGVSTTDCDGTPV